MNLNVNNSVNKIYQDIAELLDININELDNEGLKAYLEMCLHRIRAKRKKLAEEYNINTLEEMNMHLRKSQNNYTLNISLWEDYFQFAQLEAEIAILQQTLITL